MVLAVELRKNSEARTWFLKSVHPENGRVFFGEPEVEEVEEVEDRSDAPLGPAVRRCGDISVGVCYFGQRLKWLTL